MLAVHAPDKQAQDIDRCGISALTLSAPEIPDLSEIWNHFISQPEILIQKKTKKGMKELNIKSMITVKEIIMQNQKLSLTLGSRPETTET